MTIISAKEAAALSRFPRAEHERKINDLILAAAKARSTSASYMFIDSLVPSSRGDDLAAHVSSLGYHVDTYTFVMSDRVQYTLDISWENV